MSVTTALRYAGTVSQGADSLISWVSVTAAQLGGVGGTYATLTDAAFDADAISNRAILSNFTFAIPSTATILGITVEINRATTTAANVSDYTVRLTKTAGTGTGDNKAATGTNYPTSGAYATATYGGTADLWGTTWTPSEVNATGFGLIFQAQSHSPNQDIGVDYIRISVTYTARRSAASVTTALKGTLRRMTQGIASALKGTLRRSAVSVTAVLGVATQTLSRTATTVAANIATYREADWIVSSDNPTADTAELRLSPMPDPNTSSGHVLRLRYRQLGDTSRTLTFQVGLYVGATEVVTFGETLGVEWALAEHTLTAEQADAIADYSDVRVRLIADTTGGSGTASVQVSWVELETPTAGATVTGSRTAVGVGAVLKASRWRQASPVRAALKWSRALSVGSVTAVLLGKTARTALLVTGALWGKFARGAASVTAVLSLTVIASRQAAQVVAALKQLGVLRTAQTVAAALRRTGTLGTLGLAAALRGSLARTAGGLTAALSGRFSRMAGTVTASLLGRLTRTAGLVVAALAAGGARSAVLLTAALRGALTRTSTLVTANLSQQGVGSRTAQVVAAALRQLGIGRTVGSVVAALVRSTNLTVGSVTAALGQTASRVAALVTVSLQGSRGRTALNVAAALGQTGIVRVATAVTVVLRQTVGRTVAAVTASLNLVYARTAPQVVAALWGRLGRKAASVTASLYSSTVVPSGPCVGVLGEVASYSGTLSEQRGYSGVLAEVVA